MTQLFQRFIFAAVFTCLASVASAMFIQADWLDPREQGVGTNRYAYSFNDPINRLDPSGNRNFFEAVGDAFRGRDERVERSIQRAEREQASIDRVYNDIYNGGDPNYIGATEETKLRALHKNTYAARASLARHKSIIESNGGSAVGIGVDIALGAMEHGSVPRIGKGLASTTKPMRSAPSGVSGQGISTARLPQSASARNYSEQLALGATRAAPGAGRAIPNMNRDPHFAAKFGWQKMEQVFTGLGPRKSGKISVHYQVNRLMPDVAWDVKVVFNGGY